MSDYETIGGHEGLERVLDDFVRRMADDFIIGWLFAGRDLDRIVRHEVAFAAAHLGGPRAYEGRSLPEAHGPLPINRGMFQRRMALLRTVLRDHGVDEALIDRWIRHDERLEPVVTDGTDCVPPASS